MDREIKTNIIIFIAGLLLIAVSFLTAQYVVGHQKPLPEYKVAPVLKQAVIEAPTSPDPCTLEDVVCPNEPKKIYAEVTAFNTVESQTDRTPCIGFGGYICETNDTVACPRRIKLGTRIRIGEMEYICRDRLSEKYDNRFDISFDKDIQAAKEFGIQTLEVTIL